MKKKSGFGTLPGNFSTYGLAAGAALFAASTAQAGVVYSNLSDAFTLSTGLGTSNNFIPWDIDGDGTYDFDITHGIGISSYLAASRRGINNNAWVKQAASSAAFMDALNSGFVVGAGLSPNQFGSRRGYFMQTYNPTGGLTMNATQYVGFRFDIDSETHYGWADITLETTGITFNWWAYNDVADASVTVGSYPVPEPAAGGLALLALGAAGVAAYKRRRQAAE